MMRISISEAWSIRGPDDRARQIAGTLSKSPRTGRKQPCQSSPWIRQAFTMRKKKRRLRFDTLIDAHCGIRRMDQKGRFELDEGRKGNERSASSADWPKGRDRGDFTKDCSEKRMTTFEKVAESNRIEGIDREPTAEELVEHDRIMELEELTIRDLEKFVAVYQRNARLRVHPGMDVRVGSYVPPKGGEHIRDMLGALFDDINDERIDAWNTHIQYETIRPFTDGNGRSGRVDLPLADEEHSHG
jgi:hypothetical protein